MDSLPDGVRPDIDVTWKAVCPECGHTVTQLEPFLGDALRLLAEHVCPEPPDERGSTLGRWRIYG